MEALKKNPNPKPPGQKDQGQGGNSVGRKRNRGKCGGRSGSNGGQQNQYDSKKGKMIKQELAFPCDESYGRSDKYTEAFNHLIMQVGNLDIQPRKTNVNVTFVVNSKRTKVEAYIDPG